MKPLTDTEAKIALRAAQLKAGHRLNTRKQYRAWVMRYRVERKNKTVRDLQGFLTRLSTVQKRNPKTVRQALNALKFYHEKVLGIEVPPDSLEVPRINQNRNVPVWLTHREATALIGGPHADRSLRSPDGFLITAPGPLYFQRS